MIIYIEIPSWEEVLLLKDKRPIGLATVCENSFKPKKVFSEEIFNLRSI